MGDARTIPTIAHDKTKLTFFFICETDFRKHRRFQCHHRIYFIPLHRVTCNRRPTKHSFLTTMSVSSSPSAHGNAPMPPPWLLASLQDGVVESSAVRGLLDSCEGLKVVEDEFNQALAAVMS